MEENKIEELENKLASFGSSNTKLLLRSIDRMAGKIAEAIDQVSDGKLGADGEKACLPIELIESFIKMVDKSDKIKKFIEVSDSVFHPNMGTNVVEYVEEKSEPTKDEVTKIVNFFEQAQQQMKSRQVNGGA